MKSVNKVIKVLIILACSITLIIHCYYTKKWNFACWLFIVYLVLKNTNYDPYRQRPNNKKKYDEKVDVGHEITDEVIQEVNLQQNIEDSNEYAGKYQKKYLLTKNEWYEYKKLKQLAESKGLQVCPKVRLLDLIEPRRGDPKYKTYFYKVQAKHVDFVICDLNLYVKAILELDDNSHNQKDRKERDEFVDMILKDVGYTVIRTKSVMENTLDILN